MIQESNVIEDLQRLRYAIFRQKKHAYLSVFISRIFYMINSKIFFFFILKAFTLYFRYYIVTEIMQATTMSNLKRSKGMDVGKIILFINLFIF